MLSSHHCSFNLLTYSDDNLTRFTIQFPIRETQVPYLQLIMCQLVLIKTVEK